MQPPPGTIMGFWWDANPTGLIAIIEYPTATKNYKKIVSPEANSKCESVWLCVFTCILLNFKFFLLKLNVIYVF
jgi:hypothetical protein